MQRFAKLLITFSVALFFSVTVWNNVIDYKNTFLFIQHTLSMDTTRLNPHFMSRAITAILLQHASFLLIMIFQMIIAGITWRGFFKMSFYFKSPAAIFDKASQWALLGSSLAFTLYALGFLTIAGQWFMMRESLSWNVQNSVHAFLTFFGVSMIFLYLPTRLDESVQNKN